MIGYDKLNLNHQLLLGLTFEEMTGVLTHDRAKPRHPHTLRGVTLPQWASLANGLPYIDFDPSVNVGWLDCPAADTGDLNFTTEDFSGAIWVYIDDLTTFRYLLYHGDNGLATFGWYLQVTAAPNIMIQFGTRDGGGFGVTSSQLGLIATANWYLIGFSRSGTSAIVTLQGIDRTLAGGVHAAAITGGAAELHIGIQNNETSGPMYGRIAGGPCGPRIWGGRYIEEWEHLELFNMTRHWFGL